MSAIQVYTCPAFNCQTSINIGTTHMESGRPPNTHQFHNTCTLHTRRNIGKIGGGGPRGQPLVLVLVKLLFFCIAGQWRKPSKQAQGMRDNNMINTIIMGVHGRSPRKLHNFHKFCLNYGISETIYQDKYE